MLEDDVEEAMPKVIIDDFENIIMQARTIRYCIGSL